MSGGEQLVIDWSYLAPLEQTIKGVESTGLQARWDFGCYLRDYVPRGTGGRGKVGPLQEIAAELLVSEQELRFRRQFAEQYDEGKLANALASFQTWREIVANGLERERPAIAEYSPPPEGAFDLIYADPPWRYERAPGNNPTLAVEEHYPTMEVEEIMALPVPAASSAVCFLWATNPLLRQALDVLGAWDFEYRTNLVWVKDRIGLGYYVRGQHELLLIGRRGEYAAPAEFLRPSSVLNAPRGEHSAKPSAAYELIESMYPEATRIELFARTDREGWESWGARAA